MDDCEIYCQKVYGTKKKVVKKKIPILPRVLERPRGIPENPVPYLLPEFYKETQRRVNEESPGGGGTGRFAPQESTAIVDPEPPIPPPDPPSVYGRPSLKHQGRIHTLLPMTLVVNMGNNPFSRSLMHTQTMV